MRQITIIIAGILLAPLLLSAQRYEEDDNLHIPPKLVITQGWSDDRPVIDVYQTSSPHQMLLLPMIFFDSPGEWVIPNRYQVFRSPSQTADYSDSNDIIGWRSQNQKYYEVLNIVGYRMNRDSGAVVGLRGGYSTEPGEDAALARERALVVREYLQLIWNIDSARLPILEPFSASDSSDNVLLQDEARRVEFVTESGLIFTPVRFSIINYSPLNLMMTLYITPNVEPDRVEAIEIRILDQDDEVLSHAVIPGHSDSSMYRVNANWWYGGDGSQSRVSGLFVEARLILIDGRYRSADPFPIAIHEESSERNYSREQDVRQLFGSIPFFSPSDTLLGESHKSMIREYVRMQDSINRLESREGLFVVATGRTEISESPTLDRVDVDVIVKERTEGVRVSSEMYNNSLAEEERGQLYIFSPQMDEGYDEYGYEDHGYEESYYDETYDGMEEMTEEGEADGENGGPSGVFTSDSLGQARARAVLNYIRDSLGVTLLNPQMPAELDEFRGEEFGMIRTTGISPTRGGDYNVVLLPEDRWYQRGVSLVVESAIRFDEMKDQMENRRKRMEEYQERERDRVDVDE